MRAITLSLGIGKLLPGEHSDYRNEQAPRQPRAT
jgi:hypothetical protein